MLLPKQVTLSECWARDGLQNQDEFVETTDKVQMLNNIVDAGFKRIEITSFSHPKYVPQFKDALSVLSQMSNVSGVSFKATCVNKKALERAIEAKNLGYPVNEVSFVMAASEEYNLENVKMKNTELKLQISENISLARKNNLETLVSISTAFGYNIKDKVSKNEVLELVDYFVNEKVDRIMIGDTTGIGNPKQSYELFSLLKKKYPETIFIAHFHDTKGWGIANVYSALQAGITHFDVSLGGIGGPPAQRLKNKEGKTGNVCTEDLVLMLEEMGVETGINVDKLMKAGKYSEELLGTQESRTLKKY